MAYFSERMHALRPDGLSSQDEFDHLVALECSLETRVKAEAGAVHAGRCTTGGCHDFYRYTANHTLIDAMAAEGDGGSFGLCLQHGASL
jgi:hypothetical protein